MCSLFARQRSPLSSDLKHDETGMPEIPQKIGHVVNSRDAFGSVVQRRASTVYYREGGINHGATARLKREQACTGVRSPRKVVNSISQNSTINEFEQVHSPTKSSTYWDFSGFRPQFQGAGLTFRIIVLAFRVQCRGINVWSSWTEV